MTDTAGRTGDCRSTSQTPTRRYELQLYRQGVRVVAGIDEVGRGCLAGPVVAAAVILPCHGRSLRGLEGLRDSKLLEPARRSVLSARLWSVAHIGVGICSHKVIDRYGIAAATRLAMLRAIDRLPLWPEHLLIDYVRLPLLDLPQTSLVHGDSLCLSIAAASVVAKVSRDSIMSSAGRILPGYGFERHKGYATLEHCAAIHRLGPSRIQRHSFHIPPASPRNGDQVP